ncbi:MAG: replicative DNA helicase [Eggerthellaceae bacterium]|nr:replicative DNA helicase [Eggerthellaceae bacterium]
MLMAPAPQKKDYTNQPLPSDIEAEKSVLAACLIKDDVANEVVSLLKAQDFTHAGHKTIFEHMVEILRENKHFDLVTLRDSLSVKDELKGVGGPSYLSELGSFTSSLLGWRNHVEIVRRIALQRDLIFAALDIQSLAYDPPQDIKELVGEAEKSLFNTTETRLNTTAVPINELVSQVYEEIATMAEHAGAMMGVATGFIDLDKIFWGWRGGDLVILAARPSVGKTALALNMAINAAKTQTRVAVFSLEMSATQLMQRVLCSEARVSLSKVRQGQVKQNDIELLLNATTTLSNVDLVIDDSPGLTLFELRAKARRLFKDIKSDPEKKGLIIIDYLQLMQPATPRRDGNRAVEVAEISRGLKVLAKELDVPILALSQLSRAVESRGNKRPMLSDLRESGAIEQDADIVMFIDRSIDAMEAERSDRPPLNTADVIVAKHRNGSTGDVRLSFSGEFTHFDNHYEESSM